MYESVTPGQMKADIRFTESGKHIIFITAMKNIILDDDGPWVNVIGIDITSHNLFSKVKKQFYYIAAYISVSTGYKYFHYSSNL